jgi:hypothetical protein
MRRRHTGGFLELLRARGTLAWGAAILSCIGATTGLGEWLGMTTPALAQAVPGLPSPPDNAPDLSAGQRVRTPFGWLQISSFSRSQKNGDTIFDISFLAINVSARDTDLYLADYVRLIADEIPRAPFSTSSSASGRTAIPADSGVDCNVKFSVRGQPHVVHIQFGTQNTGRSFLRWPE